MDAFADLVRRVPQSVAAVIIPSWIVSPNERWSGRELANGVGVTNVLMRMNLRLIDALAGDPRVVFCDTLRWTDAAGDLASNPTLWYLSKTPFHMKVFKEAAMDVLAIMDGIQGRSKKVVLLDLDDTLWGGIVGDVGWEKLRLGGHDPVGEAFVDFQRALKRLVNRGIVLGLVSKNEEAVALEAIARHPEMVLKLNDFAGWRINWQDKAKNISDLLSDLNLGLDAAVFFDDNPYERGRVREALPQVVVPDVPADPTRFPTFLSSLRVFDTPATTEEDRGRTKMYVADRQRVALKNEVGPIDAWLRMLGLTVTAERLNRKNLERAAQLFNKTNQMNLSTRRLATSDLLSWAQTDGHALWTFRVADKFGDYGLCGIASLVRDGLQAQMLDFLLSCRVMGRGVEAAMLATLVCHARDSGVQMVWADYVPSPKNQPCCTWLRSLNADWEENRISFGPTFASPVPGHIAMIFPDVNDKVGV